MEGESELTVKECAYQSSSIRKERKVKPGFVPTEDVARFRPSRLLREREGDQEKKQQSRANQVVGSSLKAGDYKQRKDDLPSYTQTRRTPNQSLRSKADTESNWRTPRKAEKSIPDTWDDDETPPVNGSTDRKQATLPGEKSKTLSEEKSKALPGEKSKALPAESATDPVDDVAEKLSSLGIKRHQDSSNTSK